MSDGGGGQGGGVPKDAPTPPSGVRRPSSEPAPEQGSARQAASTPKATPTKAAKPAPAGRTNPVAPAAGAPAGPAAPAAPAPRAVPHVPQVPVGPTTGGILLSELEPPDQPLRPPLLVRRAAFILVLVLTGASVLVGLFVDFRLGAYTLAAACGAGAVARAVLPPYLTLGLLVRSRVQDVITLVLLCAAVIVAATVVPDG